MVDKCICCGAVVPEGRQVCPSCESRAWQRSPQHNGNAKITIVLQVDAPPYMVQGINY